MKSRPSDMGRLITYSLELYLTRFYYVLFFSIPFIIALLIPIFVSAPSFLTLGAIYIRSGSIPDISTADIIITIIAYLISIFLIADSITNITLLIKSKRTLMNTTSEVWGGLTKYATRIFLIYTIMLLLLSLAQLLTFDIQGRTWIYPIFSLALSYLLFFVAPAIVIDDETTFGSVRHSVNLTLRRPLSILIHAFVRGHLDEVILALRIPLYILVWTLIGLTPLMVIKFIFDVFSLSWISEPVLLVFNAVLILPFLIILQTQIYMDKYPLAH